MNTENNSVKQDGRPRPPQAASQVQLSLEEIKVLKECRVNSVYYRGLPLGLMSVIVARGAVQSGYFPRLKKWSGLFYTGMFGLGFFSGIASYRKVCFKKIMALENSVLADQFREFQRKAGIPVTYPSKSSDLERSTDERMLDQPINNLQEEHDSPLMSRMQGQESFQRPQSESDQDLQQTSKWSELRQKSRQANTVVPTSPDRGITYDELRKRNRSSHPGENDIPLAENDKRSINFDPSSSSSSFDDKKSSALDFSRDDNFKTTLYSQESNSGSTVRNDDRRNDVNDRPRKTFTEATGRKNAYGDNME